MSVKIANANVLAQRVQNNNAQTSKRILGRVIILIAALIVLLLLIDGFSYYTTPYADRPHHPDYRALRPAGSRGLLYGMIGTMMMLLMHLYSVRKRIKLLNKLVSLSSWLNFLHLPGHRRTNLYPAAHFF